MMTAETKMMYREAKGSQGLQATPENRRGMEPLFPTACRLGQQPDCRLLGPKLRGLISML